MESALAILDKIFGKREETEIIHFSQRGKVASCEERVHKGNYLRCLANVTCDKCLDAVERIANERDWYDIPLLWRMGYWFEHTRIYSWYETIKLWWFRKRMEACSEIQDEMDGICWEDNDGE